MEGPFPIGDLVREFRQSKCLSDAFYAFTVSGIDTIMLWTVVQKFFAAKNQW
jgi:hypothetical protein